MARTVSIRSSTSEWLPDLVLGKPNVLGELADQIGCFLGNGLPHIGCLSQRYRQDDNPFGIGARATEQPLQSANDRSIAAAALRSCPRAIRQRCRCDVQRAALFALVG